MHGLAPARAVAATLLIGGLLALGGACKGDGPPPAPVVDAAAPTPPAAPRPAPWEDPATALQALFDALKTNDRAAVEAVLISSDECVSVTKDAARCQGIAARRKAFLDLFARTPLPQDAQLVNIMLLKSVELSADDQHLTRAVRIQPANVKFRVGDSVTTLRSVAAIEVQGGWRVLPGKPQASAPPAGAPPAPPAPAAPAAPAAPPAPAPATPAP